MHVPDQDLPADRQLALASATAGDRDPLAALFALDARLAAIVRAARDPLVGQMRLTWWYDALTRLDTALPPAEPLLQALVALVLPRGVTGAALAEWVAGWEMLLEEEQPDAEALGRFATARGAALFAAAGQVSGASTPALVVAGRGWALADLAGHFSHAPTVEAARTMATDLLRQAFANRWPIPARPVGVLALVARLDLESGGALAKALRVTRFRLTGR